MVIVQVELVYLTAIRIGNIIHIFFIIHVQINKNRRSHSMWSYNVKERADRLRLLFRLYTGPLTEYTDTRYIARGTTVYTIYYVSQPLLYYAVAKPIASYKSVIAGCASAIPILRSSAAKPPEKNPAGCRTIIPSNLFRLLYINLFPSNRGAHAIGG